MCFALLTAQEIQHGLRALRGMRKRQPVARIREDCKLAIRHALPDLAGLIWPPKNGRHEVC